MKVMETTDVLYWLKHNWIINEYAVLENITSPNVEKDLSKIQGISASVQVQISQKNTRMSLQSQKPHEILRSRQTIHPQPTTAKKFWSIFQPRSVPVW